MLSILLGLLSALSWGAGDFTGGLAARKVGAYRSVFYAELIGILFLFALLLFLDDPIPDVRARIFALLAGMLGTIGLMLLYHAMAVGTMSIAAPVSALLAAVLPVTVGVFTEGFPGYLTFIGFGFALVAVWMISQSEDGVTDILSHLADLKLPLLAGIGFGFYFVFMHQATRDGGAVWHMVFSRAGGMALIVTYLLVTRSNWQVQLSALPIISVNGILDLGGNFFFILAGQAGRLDVASVLSSLFPGATVILASVFLKERLNRSQWIGVVCALIAIVLMTA
ncbi:MAG: EamA family transporter [Anaerolineales bacterium]|nr:EamA family transporter [Chloroflexota bacterium]MBK6645935.1 EamA family transporter [Anaerolineales bacterium]MCC6985124.1 EamA family transporter [Anaerolineales bacterium]